MPRAFMDSSISRPYLNSRMPVHIYLNSKMSLNYQNSSKNRMLSSL